MIPSNFYETLITYNEFEAAYTISGLSTSINPGLTDKTADPLKAYYMGETPADKTLFNYNYSIDNTDEHNFVFKAESLHVKPKWLYGMASSSDQNHAVAWNGSRWIGSTNLINSMYPYYYNQIKTASVRFKLLTKSYSESLAFTGTVYVCSMSSSGVNLQFTPSDFYEFFENGGTKTITIDGHTITFSMANWSEDGWYFDIGNDMRLYVITVDITTTEHSGRYYPNSGMKFFSMQTIGTADANHNKIGCIYGQASNYYASPDIRLDFTSTFNLSTMSYTSDVSTYTITNGDNWFGNIRPFEVGQDAAYYCRQRDISNTSRLLLPDDTLLEYTGTSGSSYYVRMNHDMINFPGWYQTLYCLLPKTVTDKNADGTAATPNNTTAEYHPYNAVPIFQKNVPIGHMEKTNTYPTLEPRLMVWQKYGHNINENDYDPDAPLEPYMEWYEVLTYDISCYKDATDETKIKLEFKQPVEKNGNPLKTTTIIFSENENNWTGTVTETPETSEGEIKITPFYLGECLSRRCNNEQ